MNTNILLTLIFITMTPLQPRTFETQILVTTLKLFVLNQL